MSLRKLPYDRLEPLITDHLCDADAGDETAELIKRLRSARQRGYLTSAELEDICRWKSARAIQHIRANSASVTRAATAAAFKTRSERRRLEALMTLKGVSVPMASAVLMLLDPKRYGVIDIRVWQLLFKMGAVTKKPRGVGFTFNNWYQFLMIIRHFARKLGVSARRIERTLFEIHRSYQSGRLYLD